jgi:hypothetical protein
MLAATLVREAERFNAPSLRHDGLQLGQAMWYQIYGKLSNDFAFDEPEAWGATSTTLPCSRRLPAPPFGMGTARRRQRRTRPHTATRSLREHLVPRRPLFRHTAVYGLGARRDGERTSVKRSEEPKRAAEEPLLAIRCASRRSQTAHPPCADNAHLPSRPLSRSGRCRTGRLLRRHTSSQVAGAGAIAIAAKRPA